MIFPKSPSFCHTARIISHVCLTPKPVFPSFLQGKTSPQSIQGSCQRLLITLSVSQFENKFWNSEWCIFILRSSANFLTNAQYRHGQPCQEFYWHLQSTVDCIFDSFKTSLIALLISNTLRTLLKAHSVQQREKINGLQGWLGMCK